MVGTWKTENNQVICSKCGKHALERTYNDYGVTFSSGLVSEVVKSQYCPHCGAHMKGGEEE